MYIVVMWLYQNVLGNIVATLLIAIPSWTYGYLKLKRLHNRHHAQLQSQITSINAQLDKHNV